MDNLAFARAQMGLSLAFHIVFAVIRMWDRDDAEPA